MKRQWLAGTYATLAVIFSVILTRVRFPGFPDLPVAFFAASSFSCPYPFSLALGIVLGLLGEGLYPADLWVSPLLYVLLSSASFYSGKQMNLRGWPLALYFLFWGIAFKTIPPIFHSQRLGFLDTACGSALTGILAYLLYLPWRKEE
jgi:hypothetical protein